MINKLSFLRGLMSLKAKISITIDNIMHLTITRSLANKSITDLIQYDLTTFQTVKVSAMSEMFQYCFE